MDGGEHNWHRSPGGNTKMPNPNFGLRHTAALVMWLMLALHRPLWLFSTRPRTVGWRSAGDWKVTMWGLGTLAVWSALTLSTPLLYVGGGLAVLVEVMHRMLPGGGHSRDFGECGISHLTRNNNLLAYRLMGALAMLGGMGCWQFVDKGSGSYLFCAGFALLAVVQFLHTREKHIRQDQEDAVHYAEMQGR